MTQIFNKKILIVEDDNDMRNVLSSHLGREYEIVRAEDGEQGLQYAEEFRPDLILLDLLLPKMGGLDMLEKLRKNPDPSLRDSKVIVFSNFSSVEWIARATELGVKDYLVKTNTTVEDLISKIEAVFKAPPIPKPTHH